VETYDMGNLKKKERETSIPWIDLVDRSDPSRRTAPVATYVFDDGRRVFYKPRKK
jgi:hypothetical protein